MKMNEWENKAWAEPGSKAGQGPLIFQVWMHILKSKSVES